MTGKSFCPTYYYIGLTDYEVLLTEFCRLAHSATIFSLQPQLHHTNTVENCSMITSKLCHGIKQQQKSKQNPCHAGYFRLICSEVVGKSAETDIGSSQVNIYIFFYYSNVIKIVCCDLGGQEQKVDKI